jgi:hypothetical protein
LTPEVLARCYDFLAATKPFCDWNLPDSEYIKFKVTQTRSRFADHEHYNGGHIIRVSAGKNGFATTLVTTMAHELIHVYLAETGIAGSAEHGEAFQKLAGEVCRIHGYDPKSF